METAKSEQDQGGAEYRSREPTSLLFYIEYQKHVISRMVNGYFNCQFIPRLVSFLSAASRNLINLSNLIKGTSEEQAPYQLGIHQENLFFNQLAQSQPLESMLTSSREHKTNHVIMTLHSTLCQ